MTGAPRNNLHIAILGILGLLLVAASANGLLCTGRQAGSLPSAGFPTIFATVTAGLTLLLTAALLSLARSTGRKQLQQEAATQALLASRARTQDEWQQAFDTMPDLVSVHDRDFRVIKANSALCDFLGKRPEEVIGRPCYQIFHTQDHPIDGCPHDKARDLGHAVTLEVSDPRLGVPLLITCSPFFDEEGNFAGSVHIARFQANRSVGRDAPQRFIPICASCKDIRDERGSWMPVEDFLSHHLTGRLTHSICKACQKRIYPEFLRD